MTNQVIELLRFHENPCAVLSREFPRFEPFDLAATLRFAEDSFGEDSKKVKPYLIGAAWNAHHQSIHWEVQPPRRPRNIHSSLANHQWGWQANAATRPVMWFYQNGQACCMFLYQQDSLPFLYADLMYDDYKRPWGHWYIKALCRGMEQSGAQEIVLDEPIDGRQHIKIPFEVIPQCASKLEQLLTGDELVRYDIDTYTYLMGPLLEELVATSRHITPEEMTENLNRRMDEAFHDGSIDIMSRMTDGVY